MYKRQVVALIIALDPPIFVGLFAQFGVYGVVAASIAPLTFGIFARDVNRRDVMIASVAGIATHLGFYAYNIGVAGRTFIEVNPSITASAGAVVSVVLLGVATMVRRQAARGATRAV